MAIVLTVDERSNAARAFLEFVKNLPFITVKENTRYNAETEGVIRAARKGKDVIRVKNSAELFKELGI